MKKILLSLVIVAALVACNNSTAVKTTAADEAYTKNLATAQAFFAAFAAKDSVKMASYVTDNFMWSPPAVGQDSLSKDVWYAQMQVFMNTYDDITLTNPLWRKGVDMDNNLDGSVRVYGLWNSKFASSGKTGLLKFYASYEFDKDGKIISWNKRAQTLFGKTEEEVIGKKVYETVFSESHSILCRSNINNYIEKGDTSNMFRQIGCVAVNKENKEFPIEIAITPILQNKKLIFYLFVKDITEVKKANNFSLNQEQKYRNIISNINIGIIEVDNEGLIQFANQNFSLISGYEISELIGKNPNDLFESRKSIDIVESKKKIREIGIADIYQLEVINKQGEIRWWIISGAPNYDNMGNIARPTDQRFKFGMLFQDYIPSIPSVKMYLNLVYNTGVPGGSPAYTNPYDYQNRLNAYKRADIGISYVFADTNNKHNTGWLKNISEFALGFEIFNMFDVQNSITNTWVRDVYSKRFYGIPNYMTPRVLNIKMDVKF